MFIARVWKKLAQRGKRPGFHSPHGGLWTDRLSAREILDERLRSGSLREEDAVGLRHWMERGYWIERRAVSSEVLERIEQDIERLWAGREPGLLVELGGEYRSLETELRAERYKLVDLYVHSAAALEAALAEPIRRFLELVFDEPPLLFQSLSFERGSEQPVHQDPAYVVVSPPLEFVASWIALEDIREGSGELVYYPGSHRLTEFLFRGGYRNWNRERDGLESQERYQRWLADELAARGLEPELLRIRKGDVLFWSADLAHGGSKILDPDLSRKSLICHYCPQRAEPYYFHYRREKRATRPGPGGARYASSHYPLGGEV